jgi:hypothetical protein
MYKIAIMRKFVSRHQRVLFLTSVANDGVYALIHAYPSLKRSYDYLQRYGYLSDYVVEVCIDDVWHYPTDDASWAILMLAS